MESADCQPDFCLDLYEPSGHGRRRRDLSNSSLTEFTKFKENIEYTVMMPGDYNSMDANSDQCKHFVVISMLLAVLLAFATILVRKIFLKCSLQAYCSMEIEIYLLVFVY